MLVFYMLMLLFITHNVVNFIVKQKRFKSLHITYFYVLTSGIVIVRCIWMIMIFLVISNSSDTETVKMQKAIELADALGTYFELLLGI